MRQGDDPYGMLPLAVAGIVVGLGLALGVGTLFSHEWLKDGETASASTLAKRDGRIEWAGWRRSARRDGPRWFLQVRLKGDPHGYIVSGDRVSASYREQVGPPSLGEITDLRDTEATVVVDSSLLNAPTPYLSGLHVDGETVVVLANAQSKRSSLWGRAGRLLLYGAATLLGLGILGASGHHVVVCIRYRRRRMKARRDHP